MKFVKLELTSISKEYVYPPMPIGAHADDEPKPKLGIMARLTSLPDDPYGQLNIPAEIVRGAQIGDVFNVYIEDAGK